MGTKALKGLVAAYAFTAVAQPHLAPLALDDSDDIERYLAAFPATEYNIVESPRQLKDCPPTAAPSQRRCMNATIKTIETFGYRVDFNAKHDYIAVPE